MVAKIKTVAFKGVEVQPISVEVQISSGLPRFNIVGLADKAITEAKERITSVFSSIGLQMPPKKIIVNLAPADVFKEGSHFDLPIAMGILSAMNVFENSQLSQYIFLGELGLDGNLAKVAGVMPASFYAAQNDFGIVCPKSQGSEALWAGNESVLAPFNILELINHFADKQILPNPERSIDQDQQHFKCFSDVKGQAVPKRVLEIAAAGGHNLLFTGPAGSGKSIMAERLPTILPPMSAREALDVSMVHSVAGILNENGIEVNRPFRSPHHTASQVALTGGGLKAKPGEVSLAHNGVLFLDELPEFSTNTLDSLRQPMETGQITISRANNHITYPANFQLIAAMNPCKCGHFGDKENECNQAPICALKYQSKISGPMFDRIDLYTKVDAIKPWELSSYNDKAETSEEIRKRVIQARQIQTQRFDRLFKDQNIFCNKSLPAKDIEQVVEIRKEALDLLIKTAEKFRLSARAYHKVLKVARTIADLEFEKNIEAHHIAEAIQYRRHNIKL